MTILFIAGIMLCFLHKTSPSNADVGVPCRRTIPILAHPEIATPGSTQV